MKKSLAYYEALLRRLRNHPRLWDGGSKADQISHLMETVKLRCQPAWLERVQRHEKAYLNRWFAIQ